MPQKGGKREMGNGEMGTEAKFPRKYESKRNPSRSNLLRTARTKDTGQRGARAKNWRPSVTDNEDVNHMLSLVREGRRKETRLRHREKGRERERKERRIYACVSDTP